MDVRPLTRVDLTLQNNLWWSDNFQFGEPTDFTWNLSNANLYLNVTTEPIGQNPVLLQCSTALGNILIVDPVNRVVAMNVSDIAMRAALGTPPAEFVYDMVMQDKTTGVIEGLMYGEIDWHSGVTITGT